MIVLALVTGIVGLLFAAGGSHALLRLHTVRKLTEVTGTVVARERVFTGRSNWTYPVVEYTARDGTQIRRTFHQLARPTIGRKLRIVYDPSAPEGRRRSPNSGVILTSSEPTIYSAGLVLWLSLMTAFGLALVVVSIAVAVAGR